MAEKGPWPGRYELVVGDGALALRCRECGKDVAYHASPVGVAEEIDEDMDRHDKLEHAPQPVEATANQILHWVFDHDYQARSVALKLNHGQKVYVSDKPPRRSFNPGWGLKRDGRNKWYVYGRSIV